MPGTKRVTAMRGILGGAVLVGAAVAAFVLTGEPEPTRAQGPGVQWEELSIEHALDRARAEGKRVLVKFDAEWCSYCRTLDEEVLSTREGGALTRDLIAVRFDFDAEENRPLVERYVVLGLPTTLVLTPDGTQVGRIMGYEDRATWVAELEQAAVAEDPVPALRAAQEGAPGDPEAALRLGEALLVRGSPDEGEALLERVTWMAVDRDGEADEAAAEALFLLGRYHHRVRRDPNTSRHLWRELAARFPRSDWAGGAWWWYAKAEAELGRHEVGLEALRGRAAAHPENVVAVSQWGEYVATHELDPERAAALEALQRVLPAASEHDRPELEELAGRLAD